jgi:hypothetical protein
MRFEVSIVMRIKCMDLGVLRACIFFVVVVPKFQRNTAAGSTFKFCPEDESSRFLQNTANHYEFT